MTNLIYGFIILLIGNVYWLHRVTNIHNYMKWTHKESNPYRVRARRNLEAASCMFVVILATVVLLLIEGQGRGQGIG